MEERRQALADKINDTKSTTPTTQPIAQKLTTMSEDERATIYNKFINQYASSIQSTMSRVKNSHMYNPMMGNQALKSISSESYAPTKEELERMLRNPEQNEKTLRKVNNYLEDSIMQYKRSKDHLMKILTFRYDLRLWTDFEESDKTAVLNARDRVNRFLMEMSVPYHTSMVMNRVMSNGGGFFYFKNEDDFKTLIELPVDYCYITGRWDRGFTFALDLTWFDKNAHMKTALPEIYAQYELFMQMRSTNLSKAKQLEYQYFPIPIEKGWVFTFDDVSVELIPPLTPVFKDAMAIMTYKNLLMQRTALDTWKVIAQKIPLTKDNVPIFSGEQAQMFVDFIQQVLPDGTAVFATPMETKEVDFSSGTTQDNITGRGEELFWRSAGVNGGLMDASEKSAGIMEFSLVNDGNFVNSIYNQWESFINLHLRIISRKYRFGVKFYGNSYLDAKHAKDYASFLSANNGLVGKMYALLGYEPFEIVPTFKLENALGLKELMKPIIAGSQMSGDDIEGSQGGRPEKETSDLTSSGEQDREDETNRKVGS